MAMSTMSEQEFVTNHVRVPETTILKDIQVPFGRAFMTCLKWGMAAILAGMILTPVSIIAWTMLRVIFFGA